MHLNGGVQIFCIILYLLYLLDTKIQMLVLTHFVSFLWAKQKAQVARAFLSIVHFRIQNVNKMATKKAQLFYRSDTKIQRYKILVLLLFVSFLYLFDTKIQRYKNLVTPSITWKNIINIFMYAV